jgi:hypothetical protein
MKQTNLNGLFSIFIPMVNAVVRPRSTISKAGAIEVASGHVPGHLRDDDVFFEHSEWKLTEMGKRASTAALTGIILQDPP